MEQPKQALAAHGIPGSAIAQLAAFEARNGLSVLDEVEFKQLQEYFGSFPVYRFLVPLLADGNSNYWFLYVGGPLKNMICYVSHEEVDLAPRFRRLASFLAASNAQPTSDDPGDIAAALFDFPSRQVPPTYVQDQEIIRKLHTALAAETADMDDGCKPPLPSWPSPRRQILKLPFTRSSTTRTCTYKNGPSNCWAFTTTSQPWPN